MRGESKWAAMIVAGVGLAYWPALHGGMLWDDDSHVTKPLLQSWDGLRRIWFELGATQQYYPVLHSAFWVEHLFFGDATVGYHVVNLVWHALAAILLLAVLKRLGFAAAGLAGLLFALHPVQVESVAWISEQKNTLSAVFAFAAAFVYLGFERKRSAGAYAGASVLFLLALFTKSVTATLPPALLVVFWWRRGSIEWRRDVRPLVPWFAVAIAAGLLTAHVEARYIGAQGADFALSAAQRVLIAGRALAFYAGKLLWPARLIFIYPRWTPDAARLLQWLYPLGVLAAFGIAGKVRPRGPLAALLVFAGVLAPALGFVNVYPFLFSFVADHFVYLASVGILVPAAWLLARWVGPRWYLALAVPIGLGALSWRQARNYRDADTLNRATLAANPQAWLAHYNLAVSLDGQPGRREEAIAEYRKTLELKPDHYAAHTNLGSDLLHLGGHEAEAIREYEAALKIRPDFAVAQNDLGVAMGQAGIPYLREAIRLQPTYAAAHNNLGVALLRSAKGKNATGASRPREEAVAQFREAVRYAPESPEYHYDLADALAGEPGHEGEAEQEYRAALHLRPDYLAARSNLGALLARMPGRLADAVTEEDAAVALVPQNAQLQFITAKAHLSWCLALAKDPARRAEAAAQYRIAVAHLQTTLQLAPNFQPAVELMQRLKR